MTASQQAIRDACLRAGAVLALTRTERDERGRDGGPEAVGAAAGGTPQQQEAVAVRYETWRQQAIKGSAA